MATVARVESHKERIARRRIFPLLGDRIIDTLESKPNRDRFRTLSSGDDCLVVTCVAGGKVRLHAKEIGIDLRISGIAIAPSPGHKKLRRSTFFRNLLGKSHRPCARKLKLLIAHRKARNLALVLQYHRRPSVLGVATVQPLIELAAVARIHSVLAQFVAALRVANDGNICPARFPLGDQIGIHRVQLVCAGVTVANEQYAMV